MVKAMNAASERAVRQEKRKRRTVAAANRNPPREEQLLTEIRDLIQAQDRDNENDIEGLLLNMSSDSLRSGFFSWRNKHRPQGIFRQECACAGDRLPARHHDCS
jgi:hypothetical protein